MRCTSASRESERGQILVMFAVGVVALLLMAGLVFDGAQALTRRRQLQDAGDSAALAAANILQVVNGCSATAGPPTGPAQSAIRNAVLSMIHTNVSGLPDTAVSVSCPDVGGKVNSAVEVDLTDRSPGFFGSLAGFGGFRVGTTSQAENGQFTSSRYSIVELDPSNMLWPNGRQGCPSVLISGGPTVTLEASMMINSSCPAYAGGPLGTNGNSATVSLLNNSTIRMVGPYVPSTLTITPTPVKVKDPVGDPLSTLAAVPVSSLPVIFPHATTLNGGDTVLQPGVYTGGIRMKNSARAFLLPGIYVMNGGGFSIGAQNAVYSIPSTLTTTSDATWPTDCVAGSCGVLILNTGITGSTDDILVGAGATLKLRPYSHTADMTNLKDRQYDNLLLWQDVLPKPSSSFAQPDVNLSGGGTVDLSGTVYAPSATLVMTGGSGGSGGSATDVTLQFITWDLTLKGNSSFHFYYQSDAFALPLDYGLIK